ncbi:MAG: hypothetical protein QM811_22015 [Pirellulales bacterium]
MRNAAGGAWRKEFARGSAVLTGFGYFAERAEADGIPYVNTSLGGRGAKYPDPASKFFASEDNYLLLTAVPDGKILRIELKSLTGKVLDTIDVPVQRNAADGQSPPTTP